MGLGWKIVIGVVVVVWWLVFGSRECCPSCGVSLEEDVGPPGPLQRTRTRDSCICGWRRK